MTKSPPNNVISQQFESAGIPAHRIGSQSAEDRILQPDSVVEPIMFRAHQPVNADFDAFQK
jgi:hypothetical protein